MTDTIRGQEDELERVLENDLDALEVELDTEGLHAPFDFGRLAVDHPLIEELLALAREAEEDEDLLDRLRPAPLAGGALACGPPTEAAKRLIERLVPGRRP